MISLAAYRIAIGSFFNKANTIKSKNKNVGIDDDDNVFIDNFIFVPSSGESMTSFLGLLGTFLVLFVIYCNYNMATYKLLKLLIDGDIESNPGPADKSVMGTFNQGDINKFGATAGVQCMCNALFSLCWANIKKVSMWKTFDLDNILNRGDQLYKTFNITEFLSIPDLPNEFVIEEHTFQVNLIYNATGMLSHNSIGFISNSYNSLQDIGTGLLFLIDGFTFSVIWSKSGFYVFDSHSRDSESFQIPNGTSVLLRFRTLSRVEKYILDAYLQDKSKNIQYEVQYVNIGIDKTEASEMLRWYNKERSQISLTKCRSNISRSTKNDKVKEDQRLYMKNYRSNLSGSKKHQETKTQQKMLKRDYISNIVGSEKHNEIKKQGKTRMTDYRSNMFGSEKHEEIKKQGKTRMTDYRSNMFGSEKHEEIKKQGKAHMSEYRSNIFGSEKH